MVRQMNPVSRPRQPAAGAGATSVFHDSLIVARTAASCSAGADDHGGGAGSERSSAVSASL